MVLYSSTGLSLHYRDIIYGGPSVGCDLMHKACCLLEVLLSKRLLRFLSFPVILQVSHMYVHTGKDWRKEWGGLKGNGLS